jgi:hypothetical protein
VALRHALTLAPHERALLGEKARARVPGFFSKDLMCRRTLAIYQEVLNTAVR